MKEKKSSEKKTLADLTGKDLGYALDKLTEGDLIYQLDFSQIAKYFLGDYLDVAPFNTDFETLRNTYMSETEDSRNRVKSMMLETFGLDKEDEIPEDPHSFFKYICKTYLDLVREPMQELGKIYEKTTSDIREIDKTLSTIDVKLKDIFDRNDPAEIQELNPIYYYYKEHNERARAEILRFLLHEVKPYALSASMDHSLLGGLMGAVPYNYGWNAESYKPRMPNDLMNKFGNLPYPDFVKLYQLYNDDKEAFGKYLLKYIDDNQVVFFMDNQIKENHILSGKAELIIEALKTYGNGSKIMFASAIPTIIEGILHEVCLVTGTTELDLMQSKHGFQYKLDELNKKLGVDLCYEYYSFRFRIFRNKVAHGRLTKEDARELADMLLLDLRHICSLVFNKRIPLNKQIAVITELSKDLVNPDYKKLVEYVFRYRVEIPDFYMLKQQRAAIDRVLLNDGFWDFILEQIESGGENWRHTLVHIAGILKKIAPDDKWRTIYIKTGLNKAKKEYVDDLIKYIHSDYVG